jgi:hypothetical protein
MTILASTVINRVAAQLMDITNVQWPRAQLLDWINMGERLIVVLQPNATNTILATKLAAGSRQSIPANGWILLDILRNMGPNGATPGRAITAISRRLLDAYNPTWHTDTPSPVTQHYLFDLQDQTAFFVYPPSDGTNYIEINYSALPTPLASESSPMNVPDAYEEPLNHYVMYRALSKNADFANSPGADKYLDLFNSVLGAKVTAEQANNPNLGLAPPNPSQVGGVV